MATDFHTHKMKSAAAALVSVTPEQVGEYPLVSLECHPWNIADDFEKPAARLVAALPRAAALGEIGLDRLRGPAFPVQQRALKQLLELAETCRKPVVLHCVRAIPELLEMTRNFRGNRLFHGFRGKPELLDELQRHGFFVSLPWAALDNVRLMEFLGRRGLARIGFETDDAPEPVEELLAVAATRLKRPFAEIEQITDTNFREFLNHV